MVYIISIEGNIGSGKSTFITYLKEKTTMDIVFVDEPVDEWSQIKDTDGKSILEKFYENQKEYVEISSKEDKERTENEKTKFAELE